MKGKWIPIPNNVAPGPHNDGNISTLLIESTLDQRALKGITIPVQLAEQLKQAGIYQKSVFTSYGSDGSKYAVFTITEMMAMMDAHQIIDFFKYFQQHGLMHITAQNALALMARFIILLIDQDPGQVYHINARYSLYLVNQF
jgi:hypothetical protein